MNIWDNNSLSEALGVPVDKSFTFGNILQFNSQDIQKGDIFIALKSGIFNSIAGTSSKNAHDYAKDALQRGASCVILEKYVEGAPHEKTIIVPDTKMALERMVKYKRSKSKATFIAVTGSAGKTSTKDWLLTTLLQFDKTIASRNSFNNILGVSLDLASMPDDIKYAVFEVGMNNPGEIREMIPYIEPDIAIINNILPAHIGHFGSLESIANAKLEILESLNKNGSAIFNIDSDYYDHCVKRAKELGINRIFSFGDGEFGKKADAILRKYNFKDASHIVEIDNIPISFSTKIGGRHRLLNLVAILLICKILKLDLEKAAQSFINLEEPKGRGRISHIKYNNTQCTIIDDAYNASPETVRESLIHFKTIDHKYKTAILGDMRELGENEVEYHTALLPQILNAGIDKVHTVGKLMFELYQILPEKIKGMHFNDYLELEAHLKQIIDRDQMILLKASKGIKLWHIVSLLTEAEA